MNNENLEQLIALYLAGEASPQQEEELFDLLHHDKDALFFFEAFSEYWNGAKKTEASDIQDEIHFQQIISIAEKRPAPGAQGEVLNIAPSRKFSFKSLLVAASIVALVIVGFVFYSNSSASESNYPALNEVVAKKGTRTHLVLPDGSTVWLNADSRLEYAGSFSDSLREVTLTGEAFFDIKKDAQRPFVVHTSDLDIKVLGTAFNVKSYPRDEVIETTLIHGMIEVSSTNQPGAPKVILHPHDKLVFNKTGSKDNQQISGKTIPAAKPFTITTLPRQLNDTAIRETAWIYNKLIFDGETFREIAAAMERWYDVKIVFHDEKIASLPIHVQFRNETIDEALFALQQIESFSYKKSKNQIDICKK